MPWLQDDPSGSDPEYAWLTQVTIQGSLEPSSFTPAVFTLQLFDRFQQYWYW